MNDVKMGLTPLEARQQGDVAGSVVPERGAVGFTPGPWVWENRPQVGLVICGNPGIHDFVEWSSTGEGPIYLYGLVATSPPVTIAYERWVRFEPEAWNTMQEANARLIAAAPDLYEAVVACKKVLDALTEPSAIRATNTEHVWAHAMEAENKARKAILKATRNPQEHAEPTSNAGHEDSTATRPSPEPSTLVTHK